jgi:hypothetical protein
MFIRKVRANMKRLRGRKSAPIQLPFPVSPTLRLAQLSSGPKFAGVQPFRLKKVQDLRTFAPNVVVGSASELRRFAEQAVSSSLDTSSIDHALVVVTHYGTQPLTDLVRVTLWQAFGVPIFELYLGLDYGLLCAECEAHEGWHLAPGVCCTLLDGGEMILSGGGNNGLHTGFTASLDPNPCPCGRPSPRVLDIEQVSRPEALYLAASA